MNFPLNCACKLLYGFAVGAAAVLAAFAIVEHEQNASLLFWTVLAVLVLGRATGQFVPLSHKDEVS